MKKILNVTKDHLKLLSMALLENNDDSITISKDKLMVNQSHLLDDVSLVLGLRDKMIPNTEDSADGMAFPDDIEEYMVSTYKNVVEHLYDFETLLHQMILQGGIVEGIYECDSKDGIWFRKFL